MDDKKYSPVALCLNVGIVLRMSNLFEPRRIEFI